MLSTIEELIEEFSDLDEREACELLDELGRQIPAIPKSVYANENLVPGCQSRVWVENRLRPNGTVEILADSEAFVVKGLIFVVLEMFRDKRPEEILATNHETILDRMGVGKLILPQRKNGLYSLVKNIHQFCAARAGLAETKNLVSSPITPLPNPTRQLSGVVESFPILCRKLPNGKRPVFLDSGASAQKPECVLEKMLEAQREYYANAFRGKYYFGQRVDEEIESTRSKVAGLVGSRRADEIIFTAGTTMSINLVAQAWGRSNLGPGDEVLVTEMEHHANFVPWQAIAQAQGAKFKVAPITTDGLLDMSALESQISERTKMVAVCSMSNVLGTVNPIDEIIKIAHGKGALVFVDAAQSVPHQQIDVVKNDVDFLTFSPHKLYGPSGVGVLYAKRTILETMDPFLYGGHMIETVGLEESTWAETPAKFEAGTPPIVPIIGLGAAIDFVASIGYDAIARHEHELLVEAQDRLSQIPGLTIYGPTTDQKGAIISFTVEGVSTEDLAMRLDNEGVFTRHGHHCAMVLHDRLQVPSTTRATFGMYNTSDDIEVFSSAVQKAAAELQSVI